MGTPEFSVPTLNLLSNNYNVVGVFTQPPRPSGRGMVNIKSPVQYYAEKHNMNLFTPISLKNREIDKLLKILNPDVIIVVAYGLMLPETILSIPKYGCINGHASLLPKWRGAAPIQRAIEAGDKKTGCTTILMEKGLDTGPIFLQKNLLIKHNDDATNLFVKLSKLTAQCLDETIKLLLLNNYNLTPQNNSMSSYAYKLNKNEGHVDWKENAFNVYNKLKAYKIFPGSYFFYNNKKIKIIDGLPIKKIHNEQPGKIIEVSDKILIACSNNSLFQINTLQKAGKYKMTVREYLNGNKIIVGDLID